MGKTGYQGAEDDRITSYNKESDYPVRSDEHLDVFTLSKLPYFGPLTAKTAISDLGKK
jgi:hypothetical protein